ncbi:MAG TPA: DUF6122 family protein [Salinimicrobium sp.]|nr:DUF6122 family protein [Salinimicrobium sp.]
MLQTFTHYYLHFIAIGAIAYFFDPKKWKFYWLVLIATMAVDLDHLLATPIFEAGRCSIGFHPLHSFYVIPFYLIGAVFLRKPILKLICIGLIFHMLTDYLDCFISGTHTSIRFF